MPEGKLPPWIVQIAGFVVIAVALAAWWRTSRETSLFLGAGMLMVLGGEHAKRGNGA